jgi:hypothetical protein
MEPLAGASACDECFVVLRRFFSLFRSSGLLRAACTRSRPTCQQPSAVRWRHGLWEWRAG